jgi:hypothetical protein
MNQYYLGEPSSAIELVEEKEVESEAEAHLYNK